MSYKEIDGIERDNESYCEPDSFHQIKIAGGTQIKTTASGSTLTIDCTSPVINDFVAFKPAISGSTSAGTATYSVRSGWYTKINTLIYVVGSLTWSAHTGTGNMLISNLPFKVRAEKNYDPEFTIKTQDISWTNPTGYVFGEFQPGTTTANIGQSRTNMAEQLVQMSKAGTVHFSGWYSTS